MKRPGFILIQVVIASAIGAVLAGMMFTSLFQTMRYQTAINETTSLYMRAIVFNQQLEHDISGAFVPHQALDIARTATQSTPQSKQNGQEQKKKLEDVFLATTQDGNVIELAFITYNTMQGYWSDQTGKPHPRIARIVYRLTPDNEHTGSFIVTRQEGDELDLKAYAQNNTQTVRSYTLLDGVKSFKASFSYKKPEKAEANKEKKKNDSEIVTLNAWSAQLKKEQKDMPLLPHTVEIELILWTKDYTQEEKFTFIYTIVEQKTEQKSELIQPANPKPESENVQKSAEPNKQESSATTSNNMTIGMHQQSTRRVPPANRQELSNNRNNLIKSNRA